MKHQHIRDICLIALFAALIAVCSWISVPASVPYTLQTFAVFLACGVLGGRRGFFAVLVYLGLGALGVPVFAGFRGGLAALLGTTGGYLIGFAFTALVMWGITAAFGRKWAVLLGAMAAGLLVCYAFGTAWFMAMYTRTNGPAALSSVLGWCVLPYVIPDLVKMGLALLLSLRLRRFAA